MFAAHSHRDATRPEGEVAVMRIVQFTTAWANAPFTIAFGIAAGVALLQASGALSLLGDHDADADADVDADVDGDVDHDIEAHVDGDAEHDVEGDAEEQSFLDLLGVGRIPFSLAWHAQTFAVTREGKPSPPS